MNKTGKLGAAAVAVAMLVGTSVFAESRPQRGTRSEGGRIQRGGGGDRSGEPRSSARSGGGETRSRESRDSGNVERRESTRQRDTATDRQTYDSRGDRSTREGNRSYDRNRENNRDGNRTYDRNRENNREGNRSYDRNRGNNGDSRRYESFDERRYSSRGRSSVEHRRYDHTYGYRGSNPYYHNGRVSRYERYGSGYRVWVVGSAYPFYIPIGYWDPYRFRIGVSIGLGGYYNPLGYYEYYDGYYDGYRAGSYRDGRVYNTVELTGYVEDYDGRRRTALIRDDATDRLVTVYMHSRDARLNHIRPGDYIELEGGWKNGIFEAYRVFDVD